MRHPLTARANQPQAGISLIEMVIAVLVLSIGVVAGYQSLGQARRGIGEELPRLMARQAALNRAEELRLFGMVQGAALPGTVRAGPFDWRLDITREGTTGGFTKATVRASDPNGGPGALAVVFVAPPAAGN